MSEVNFEEQTKRIRETLSTMFTFLGLTGEFRFESKPNNRIGVKISSSANFLNLQNRRVLFS